MAKKRQTVNNREVKYMEKLEKKGITDKKELAFMFPRKYYECTGNDELIPDNQEQFCTVTGDLVYITDKNNGRLSYTSAIIEREDKKLCVTWFGYNQITKEYGFGKMRNRVATVSGTLDYDAVKDMFFMTNPVSFHVNEESARDVVTVYSKMSGVAASWMETEIKKAVEGFDMEEYLPDDIIKEQGLMPLKEAVMAIHDPATIKDEKRAKERIIFDEMLYFAIKLKENQEKNGVTSTCVAKNKDILKKVKGSLPYTLTDDQSQTVDKIADIMSSGKRVNAIVQGDVSCGKTIVSFLLMMLMAANGYQSVLMAPAVILAEQHYEKLKELIEPFGFHAVMLSSKFNGRKKVLEQIKNGQVDFIVGTSSAIAADVTYHNLGLCVIDEEQKFGIEQKERIFSKSDNAVHYIRMSATPIPRTLADSIYGDFVDIYNIRQMPAGRIPQKTALIQNERQAYAMAKHELEAGHQCYVVCAKVDADTDHASGILSVKEAVARYQYALGGKYKVGGVTGKDSGTAQEEMLRKFRDNEIQVLVATTVVEVGVDVRNASLIIIHNAERFGLSTLHQLRGRVGRGNEQSYCILISEKETPRLNTMCQTTDGFTIAEADLDLRKQGNPIGLEQSGENKYMSYLTVYPEMYEKAKRSIPMLMKSDKKEQFMEQMEDAYRGEPEKCRYVRKIC